MQIIRIANFEVVWGLGLGELVILWENECTMIKYSCEPCYLKVLIYTVYINVTSIRMNTKTACCDLLYKSFSRSSVVEYTLR